MDTKSEYGKFQLFGYMANFRYWGYSIENNISWMQGSENGKFQIRGYTYKSHVSQIVLSENGKFRYQ